MSEIKELIASSLALEKAFTLADAAQRNVSRGRTLDLKPGDGARIFSDDLDDLKRKYRNGADTGWNNARKYTSVTDEPYENLANAIIERAVLDYEIALSYGDKATKYSIEEFAAGELCYSLTKLNVTEQLAIVKQQAEEYFKLVRKNYKAISAESAALRKAGKPFDRFGKYRCPLCGGRIYEFQRARSRKEYHCTGCALVGFEP